jgi:V8-like Glu-specific endopeptidase
MRQACHYLLFFLVAGVVAAQAAPPAHTQTAPKPAGQSSTPALKPNAPYQLIPPRKDIPTIVKAANGAIVSIIMSDENGHAIAQGTGFLISKDGRIVTNYHVIENGSSAVAKLPDGAFFVVDGVLASDKVRDVALIKAHGENFRTLTLGNSNQLEVGEDVVAIGNPLSLESTVSSGIVSGIRTAEKEGGKFLQVTTPISPGSSGGPLFNMAGEVVGITTLYLEGGQNLNFAIPINDAKHLLLAKSPKMQDLPNEPVNAKTRDRDAQARNQPVAGLYQSEAMGTTDAAFWQYLRIYSDGSIIGVTSTGTSDQVANWFKKPYSQTGLYQVQGSTILFSIASNYGSVDYQGQILGTGTVLSMDSFSHINGHRTHTTFHLVQPSDEDAPPSVSATAAKTNPIAHNYYQQLFDAGGFSGHVGRDYVCFSDDANSDSFFIFVAEAYDEDYNKAGKKSVEVLKTGGDTTTANPEMKKVFAIQETIQRTAPYVTFLPEVLLGYHSPENQQFLRGGGRILEETVYEKGVKVGYIDYRWDGSSWFTSSPSPDPNAYTRTSKVFHLSIEPTTMRYANSADVTITVGHGDTAAGGTDHFGPWAGTCEKVPNSN